MAHPRQRSLVFGLLALAAAWLVAWGGYAYFTNAKITAAKVDAYLHATNLATLSAKDRAAALRRLARYINSLNPRERRRARLSAEWQKWFNAMTDAEKGEFIEATLPSGFKQMLSSFEQLPEEKRKRAVDEALQDLARSRRELETQEGGGDRGDAGATNRLGELSPELREKVITLGLKSFYSESSAQTKAELAPVLEEMQRLMERGALLRGRQ